MNALSVITRCSIVTGRVIMEGKGPRGRLSGASGEKGGVGSACYGNGGNETRVFLPRYVIARALLDKSLA